MPHNSSAAVASLGSAIICHLFLPGLVMAQDEQPPLVESKEAGTPKSEVRMPRVVHANSPEYPPEALKSRQEVHLELFVTVLPDGTVGQIEIALSGGEAFDAAAIASVRKWTFEPAQRGGQAIASKIRLPIDFSPPAIALAIAPTPTPAPAPAPASAQRDASDPEPPPEPGLDDTQQKISTPPKEDLLEVTVTGTRQHRTERRSSGDYLIKDDLLQAAPHREGADALRTVPGLVIGRGEGPAVAHSYMLRGFDAEHGQDIEFRVGGLPVNSPSHIHGQGYADLGFLIGESIHEIQVSEGVYDPRQGDFAVAGSIDIGLGVGEQNRGVSLRSEYGSYNTFRQLVLWAPLDAPTETFGAVQYAKTSGFGENRAGQSASGIFQHRFGEGELSYRALGILHTARSDSAGVLRQDDIDSGEVCFECVYPYPTAEAQNGLANRFMGGLFADYQGDEGDNGQFGAWFGYDNFRLHKNFTGFIESSRTLVDVSGRGDLIEQKNRTTSFGLTGRYRSLPFQPASWAEGTIEVGGDGRLDSTEQGQNLIDASLHKQSWDRRVDAAIVGVNLGIWGDLDWRFLRVLQARFGLRANVLSYDVEDHLGNFAPLSRPQDTFIQGYKRSAMGVTWGPRASLEYRPLWWFSALAAYGEGFRSPQARLLEDGEQSPATKVRSSDVGLRFDWGDPLQITLGGYYTRLSDDVAFSAAEGRMERIGATSRLGATAYGVVRPLDWLVGSLSFTYVDARLLEPPPPSAEEPAPPYIQGQQLPFLPPVVLRADLGAQYSLLEDLASHELGSRAGLGFSFLSARPLPYGDMADPVALLDASLGLSWGVVSLDFEMFNLMNWQYAAVEYSFASDWNPNDGVRPRTPARHIAAGAPRTWLLSLGVTL